MWRHEVARMQHTSFHRPHYAVPSKHTTSPSAQPILSNSAVPATALRAPVTAEVPVGLELEYGWQGDGDMFGRGLWRRRGRAGDLEQDQEGG